MDADLLVVILPGKFGTHTELGIALGTGKRIIICAENGDIIYSKMNCVFYDSIGVKKIVGHMDDWIREILCDGRMIDSPYGNYNV